MRAGTNINVCQKQRRLASRCLGAVSLPLVSPTPVFFHDFQDFRAFAPPRLFSQLSVSSMVGPTLQLGLSLSLSLRFSVLYDTARLHTVANSHPPLAFAARAWSPWLYLYSPFFILCLFFPPSRIDTSWMRAVIRGL